MQKHLQIGWRHAKMEFHFLGTGAGVPAKKRNVSALALRFLEHKGDVWLFDCGEATQHQFLHSKLSIPAISTIFISHLHGDHLYGLPGLLSSRSFQGGRTPLTVYGPVGIKTYIQMSLATTNTSLKYELHIIELEEASSFQIGACTVSVFMLQHPVQSFGFKIEEAAQPGRLHVEALKQKGVSPGPLYAAIKKGETVQLETGEWLDGNEYVEAPTAGRTVVICGDTAPTEAVISYAKNADVLIHEATFASDQQEHASDFGHSTIQDTAALAKAANVRNLVFTHISSRYARDENQYVMEAKSSFEKVFIAYDFLVLTLSKKGELSCHE